MSDKLTDKLVGDGVKPELSPNPYGSGYTKQVEVDSLLSIDNPEVNVLYICQGRKYKYAHAIIDPGTNKILVPAGFVRVENGPQVHNVDGGRGTPVHKNVAPQVPPRVFNEPVALNGGVTIKGKTIEELIGQGGGSSEDGPKVYEVEDLSTLPSATVAQLKMGDIVVTSSNGMSYLYTVTYKEDKELNEDLEVNAIYLVNVNGVQVEEHRYVYDEENEEWVYDADYMVILESTKMYLHHIKINIGSLAHYPIFFDIYLTDNIPLTASTLPTFLNQKGFTASNKGLVVYFFSRVDSTHIKFFSSLYSNGNNLQISGYDIIEASTALENCTFVSDTVIEM